jgi:outer membrane protein W
MGDVTHRSVGQQPGRQSRLLLLCASAEAASATHAQQQHGSFMYSGQLVNVHAHDQTARSPSTHHNHFTLY